MAASVWQQAAVQGQVGAPAPAAPETPAGAGPSVVEFAPRGARYPAASLRSRAGAFGIAIAIEAAIAGALLAGLAPKLERHAAQAMQVSIVPPAVRPPQPPEPPHLVLRERPPIAVEVPLVQIPLEPPPVTSEVAAAAAVPMPPVHAPPPGPAAGPKAQTFEERMLAAIQAAVDGHYPPAARMLHQQGQAAIGFDYLDGRVSDVSLVQSSGSALLDKAAVATVRDASYPLPPPKLQHQRQHYQVWVKFELDRR